jgi:undecaprenyl-diphosphatase
LTSLQAVGLGLVQGLTEFLPVSSSGHLVLAQQFLGLRGELLSFDIFVHTGTLLAVLAVFRRRVISLALGCLGALRSVLFERTPPAQAFAESGELRTTLALIIGSVPAGIIGLTLKDPIERLFSAPVPVLFALAATGVILLATFLAPPGNAHAGIGRGLLVGIAQAIAIIPGISRSGATISTALFLSVDRAEAGEFSFLLSVPAVAGATALALRDLYGTAASIPPGIIVLGAAASFFSGYAALVLLMSVIRKGKIGYFGFYCLAVSLAGGAYLFAR